jgi:hypothetical protein
MNHHHFMNQQQQQEYNLYANQPECFPISSFPQTPANHDNNNNSNRPIPPPHLPPTAVAHYIPSSHSTGNMIKDKKVYSFVPLDVVTQKKRPRKKYNEVERLYQCTYQNCTKAYGTLNHLNAHVSMQGHGPKRLPAEFKELRRQLKANRTRSQQSNNRNNTVNTIGHQQHLLQTTTPMQHHASFIPYPASTSTSLLPPPPPPPPLASSNNLQHMYPNTTTATPYNPQQQHYHQMMPPPF